MPRFPLSQTRQLLGCLAAIVALSAGPGRAQIETQAEYHRQQAKRLEFDAAHLAFNQEWSRKVAPDLLKQLDIAELHNVQIAELLRIYETGAWAEAKAYIVSGLRSVFGQRIPNTATANPSAYYLLVELTQRRAISISKDLFGSVTDATIAQILKAGVEASIQPGANRHVLALIIATNKWERKYVADLSAAIEANEALDVYTFTRDWQSKPENAYRGIFDETYRTTPVRGDVPILRPENLKMGQHYILEQNQAPRNSEGVRELGAYEYVGFDKKTKEILWKRVR